MNISNLATTAGELKQESSTERPDPSGSSPYIEDGMLRPCMRSATLNQLGGPIVDGGEAEILAQDPQRIA